MNLSSSQKVSIAFVVSGVFLAISLSVLVSIVLPEQDSMAVFSSGSNPDNNTILNSNSNLVASMINYSILDRSANLADLERGRAYYGQLCVGCHGANGNGQGEWAYRVTPRPRDVAGERMMQRTDDELFAIISETQPGTPMVGWKKMLSERQRWQVITYLRHLGAKRVAENLINETAGMSSPREFVQISTMEEIRL